MKPIEILSGELLPIMRALLRHTPAQSTRPEVEGIFVRGRTIAATDAHVIFAVCLRDNAPSPDDTTAAMPLPIAWTLHAVLKHAPRARKVEIDMDAQRITLEGYPPLTWEAAPLARALDIEAMFAPPKRPKAHDKRFNPRALTRMLRTFKLVQPPPARVPGQPAAVCMSFGANGRDPIYLWSDNVLAPLLRARALVMPYAPLD